jgi:hypothetical protein
MLILFVIIEKPSEEKKLYIFSTLRSYWCYYDTVLRIVIGKAWYNNNTKNSEISFFNFDGYCGVAADRRRDLGWNPSTFVRETYLKNLIENRGHFPDSCCFYWDFLNIEKEQFVWSCSWPEVSWAQFVSLLMSKRDSPNNLGKIDLLG